MSRILLYLRRRSAIALSLALLATMFALPSASAGGDDGDGHGRQRFLLVSTDATDEAATVLAFGPIHAKGTDVFVSDTRDRFEFPDGNLRIRHEVKGTPKESFDEVTCLARYQEHGTYRITGGTGEYEGASGSGHYELNALAVGCDENEPPETFVLKIRARGSIDF